MKQYVLTPAAGKRLIAKAAASHPAVKKALETGTVVIVAGTTNGYVAEEILAVLGQAGFDKRRFFRGITLPPASAGSGTGEGEFPGDVVITKGQWRRGLTIFDVVDELKEGDIALKGANAVNTSLRQAAVLIGHAKGGTAALILQAAAGRRVRLILPVGLEKRVSADLNDLAVRLNAPGAEGPRLLPVPGEILTEIEAIAVLSGATAELVAGGGVGGAEGSIWLAVSGDEDRVRKAGGLFEAIAREAPFAL